MRRPPRVVAGVGVVVAVAAAAAFALAADPETATTPLRGTAPSGASYRLDARVDQQGYVCVKLVVRQPGGGRPRTRECIRPPASGAAGVFVVHCDTDDVFVAGVLGQRTRTVSLGRAGRETAIATPARVRGGGAARVFLLVTGAGALPAQVHAVGESNGRVRPLGVELEAASACRAAGRDDSGVIAFGSF